MNVLGFDTCFESCSVAVGRGLGSASMHLEFRFERMSTGQAERLVPLIGEVMEAARLRFDELERIAVTVGPGTFTGMRIGVAAARALALALEIPIVTLTSLEVMALSPELAGFEHEALLVVADARRGQVYGQCFRSSAGRATGPPQILDIEVAAEVGGSGPIVLAGSGAARVAEEALKRGRRVRAILPGLLPRMEDALVVAATGAPSQSAPKPLYLRAPDAKPQHGKSLERSS